MELRALSLIVLGKYRIERAIGGGPVGDVYRARDDSTEEVLAVKEVRRDLGWLPVIGAAAHKAVAAAARVDHLALARLHAIAEEDGRTLIVSDWSDGERLSEVVEWSEGKLPPPKAMTLFVQILTAVHTAHEQGLSHGNLKPENIHIPRGGGIKRASVIDFGVAAVLADSGVGRDGDGLIPNLPYRAPEQLRDPRALHPAVDIYAIGAVLYSILSGHQPFEAGSEREIIAKHLAGHPPPLAERARGIPTALADIVHRALADDPTQRFRSAASMAEALTRFLPDDRCTPLGSPSGAPPLVSRSPAAPPRQAAPPQRVQDPSPAPTTESGATPLERPRLPRAGGRPAIVAVVLFLLLAGGAGAIFFEFHKTWFGAPEPAPETPSEARGNAAGGFQPIAPREVPHGKVSRADDLTRAAEEHFARAEYDEAIESYLKAVALDPNDPERWWGFACVYGQQAEVEGALRNLRGFAKRHDESASDYVHDRIKAESCFDSVRAHPQFRDFLGRFRRPD